MLTFIVLLPILAAIATVLGAPARKTALYASVLNLALSLFAMAAYKPTTPGGYDLRSGWAVAPAWGLNLAFAVDGLSLVLVLLSTVVTLAAVVVTPPVEKREGLFYSCVLLISAGALGAFASVDLFFFYAFHELALIPTFLLIGIWGFGERQAAAWKITIYLALGSIVLLVGIAKLYLAYPEGARTFDMIAMTAKRALIPATEQGGIYIWLQIGRAHV